MSTISPEFLEALRKKEGFDLKPQSQKQSVKKSSYLESSPPEGAVEKLTKDKKGNLLSRMYIKDKKPHGLCTLYYPDGSIHQQVTYVEGILDGPSLVFDTTGNKQVEVTYKAGKMEGKLVSYKKGNLFATMHYKNGILDGPATYYSDQGVKSVEESFKDGGKEGLQLVYGDANNIVQKTNFEKDKKEGDAFVYYPDGATLIHSQYKNDRIEGKSVQFFKDGKTPQAISTYANGKLIEKQEFNEKGKVTKDMKVPPPKNN